LSAKLTINLLLFIFFIFNGSKVNRSRIREYHSSGLQVLVTSDEDGVEHRLIKQEVAHPFTDNDVELFDWEIHFFEFSLDEGNSFIEKSC